MNWSFWLCFRCTYVLFVVRLDSNFRIQTTQTKVIVAAELKLFSNYLVIIFFIMSPNATSSMFLYTDGTASNLEGFTVIIPSLGVGNVAQLCADLLISSFRLHKIATAWHSAIVPLLGPKAFEHDTDPTTTACELYGAASLKLAVLQLRAPIVPAALDAFLEELVRHLVDAKVARLIVTTSSYAYEKHLVGDAAFQFLSDTTSSPDAAEQLFRNLGCRKFEGDVIFGGGFARRLLQTGEKFALQTVLLFKYVSEGDNRADAAEMAEKVVGALEGDVKLVLKTPSSWKLLFGNVAPKELYWCVQIKWKIQINYTLYAFMCTFKTMFHNLNS